MSAFFVSTTPIASALRGFARAHSGRVTLHEDPLFLNSRARAAGRRVALVSGGGSGHEPMHIGLLGRGMLDAAVPGEVFASPHNGQIYAASCAVAGPDGVLQIVKNYTGDVINFRVAAERLRAAGIPVATVLVDDDIATDSEETETGRRGTGATVIVEKILGAAADSGLGLEELANLGAEVAAHSRSIAVAARAHTDSRTGRPAFELREGTLEYGVGIHGERAAASIEREDFTALITQMVDATLAALPGEPADGDLLVFVNGLGSTTQIELFNVFDRVCSALWTQGETVSASLVGDYVAALDMSGFSLTVTRLQPQWLQWWHAGSDTPAFPATVPAGTAVSASHTGEWNTLWSDSSVPAGSGHTSDTGSSDTGSSEGMTSLRGRSKPPGSGPDSDRETTVVLRFAELVEDNHERLTHLDQVSGDGDFGDNLRGGLRAATTLIEGSDIAGFAAAETVFLDGVGGTSGPLLGLLFKELSAGYARFATDGTAPAEGTDPGDGAEPVDPAALWEQATAAGCAAIQRVGGAEAGDRTVVDVLAPTASALGEGFAAAARTARESAEATADLQARRGRASYVDGRGAGTPDAGAVGISLLFTAAAEVYEA